MSDIRSRILENVTTEAGARKYIDYTKGIQQEEKELLEQEPVIYEVVLNIKEGWRNAVDHRLVFTHIGEILNLGKDRFLGSGVYHDRVNENKLTIHYYAKEKEGVYKYIKEDAQKMRNVVPNHLEGKFSATRRIGVPGSNEYQWQELV